jgi:predicted metal-dependent hydrolase
LLTDAQSTGSKYGFDERSVQIVPLFHKAGDRLRYDAAVQFRLPGLGGATPRPAPRREVRVGPERVPVAIVRHRRARRYVLRVVDDGSLRLTVPRDASIAGGVRFAERQIDWIVRERGRLDRRRAAWTAGTPVWFRGERVRLAIGDGCVAVGSFRVLLGPALPVRDQVERAWRDLANIELPARCRDLATVHGCGVSAVHVRNQRSRWGACSGRGVITLNWRLVQMPPAVADYIVIHELAHLRHPNHSSRFWREVERLCPEWRDAEQWIRRNGREIL